jgi:hypothetical protein
VYTVTGEMAAKHIAANAWSVAPRRYDSAKGGYTDLPESDAAKKLRAVWQERANVGWEKANTIRNRISSRRAAGQLARAEGRRHWYWSDYGC